LLRRCTRLLRRHVGRRSVMLRPTSGCSLGRCALRLTNHRASTMTIMTVTTTEAACRPLSAVNWPNRWQTPFPCPKCESARRRPASVSRCTRRPHTRPHGDRRPAAVGSAAGTRCRNQIGE